LPVFLLAVALFPSVQSARAQSSTPPELQLKVISVRYLPDKKKIEYKLENDGSSAVTAYLVEVSAVIRGLYDTWFGGPTSERRDLLTLELAQQCQNAPINLDDDDDNPQSDVNIPPGIIQPGKLRSGSTPTFDLIPDYLLQGSTPEVSVRVTGLIWADGRIEGTTGTPEMQRIRDDWLETAREERDLLAVLKAHQEDGDDQHRINAIIEDLQSLMERYPRQVPVPQDEPPPRTMYVWEPGLLSATIRELDYAAYRPDPIARITFYQELEKCAHERRAELQVPAMAAARR